MHQEVAIFANRISIIKVVTRDSLVRKELQQLDHRRMRVPLQVILPIISEARFKLSIQPDDVGRLQISVEGSAVPGTPTLIPSVIWIDTKLCFQEISSRPCGEMLFCDSYDPLDTLLPPYHTRALNCWMHW